MTERELFDGKVPRLSDVLSAWLLVLLAVVAMNLALTFAAPDECPQGGFTQSASLPAPTVIEATLRRALLIAGLPERRECRQLASRE